MNKADLVMDLSTRLNITQKQASKIVDAFVETVLEALKDEGRVCIMGFGSFRRRDRKSRMARNPKTGERIQVGEKSVPHFTPGKDLVEAVNPA
jgi:nucleoid DNA-binding protein